MKPKTIALLVVAITCGLGASYMTSRLLAERKEAPEETKVPILMAKAKVPAYVPIKEPEKYFEIRDVAEGTFPAKAMKSFDEIKGKQLQRPLNKDLPVTPDDVVSSETMGLGGELPEGMRAVSLKVNPETIVGGFVQPKSHVDVVVVMRRGDDNSVAKIILQNMLVLAVDVNDKTEEGKRTYLGTTVTIAAKPEETAELALAASLGEIRLILRGAGDNKIVTVKDTTPKDFGKATKTNGGPTDDGSDSGTAVAKGPAAPPTIPTLPPVEEKKSDDPPTIKPEEKPGAEEPPVETHEMTITIGSDTFKAKFIKDEKEGWKSTLNRNGDDEPSPSKPKAKPTTTPTPALAPAAPAQPGGKPSVG
jgi:Flp pilus assembly protein CpaB